jgi:hypothetical protein
MSKYSGCNCGADYFIGSSRTYYWMATDFSDWCKKQPSNEEFLGDDALCVNNSFYYNECKKQEATLGGGLDFGEQYFTYYYHYISTKLITRTGNPVMWRDPSGTDCGDALGCSYDCFINYNINCPGGGNGITQRFADKIVEYWGTPYIPGSEIDLATTFDRDGNVTPFALPLLGMKGKENPFPFEGLVYDYYSVVGQGPAILGSIFQIICTYCFGGLVPPCVDPWFTWRGFASQVYTFDSNLGIPYRITQKLEDFYEVNNLSLIDIKYNHMADEQIFVTGHADWNYGDIGKDGNVGTKLYGDYLDKFTGANGEPLNIQYEFGENGLRAATITQGSGQRYVISDLSNDVEFVDISVANRNCQSRQNISQYPWLYIDIPEPIQIEYQMALFTEIFPVAIEDLMTRFLWGHSNTYNFFGVGVKIPQIGNSFHYRKYTKKIIKAPHNLYIKNGEFSFRETSFGKTMTDLEPGRYYFPNMCYCASNLQSLSPYNGKKFYKSNSYDRSVEDGGIFNSIYNNPLIQFIDPETGDESLEARFNNAINMLGFPESPKSPAARIEESSLFSKFKSLEELMSEVEQILNFINSNQQPADYDLLPPSDSEAYNDGQLTIVNPPLD